MPRRDDPKRHPLGIAFSEGNPVVGRFGDPHHEGVSPDYSDDHKEGGIENSQDGLKKSAWVTSETLPASSKDFIQELDR